uniref:Myosin light chain 11 n=1 Tax=Mastacembelus armatus TaxID=205130 RepID=A0A3Q3N9Z9_9TELE
MAPKRAKRRQAAGEGGSSNVFSMFEQSQIQEYKEAFTIIDQNRDGIISKDDLRDVLASMGQLNVKNEELEAMIKEASGPINFTVFLTMFGEKLKGADPEDVILSAFKVLDPQGTGTIKKEFLEELLTTQCDRFSKEEVKSTRATSHVYFNECNNRFTLMSLLVYATQTSFCCSIYIYISQKVKKNKDPNRKCISSIYCLNVHSEGVFSPVHVSALYCICSV